MCHLNSFSALLCSLFLSMSETEDNFKYHLPTGLAGAIFLLLSWARYLLYKFMYYIQMLMFLIFNKCKLKNDLIIRCNISQRINRCYVFSKKKKVIVPSVSWDIIFLIEHCIYLSLVSLVFRAATYRLLYFKKQTFISQSNGLKFGNLTGHLATSSVLIRFIYNF